MGGHVVGGAFGFLCRQLGLAADYLYAVEVVTVDRGGAREQRRRDARGVRSESRALVGAHRRRRRQLRRRHALLVSLARRRGR